MNSKEAEYESPHEILGPDLEILKNAEEGNSFAQLDIGKFYYSISNQNNNVEDPFHWFMLSAKQGNMEAQFRLGDMYALGEGTEKSEYTAYDWYLKSAIQGYPKALTRLHNLYYAEKSIYCRGQRNSKEAKWADSDFKKKNNIRELYEYRVQQLGSELTNTKEYFTRLLKICREQISDDEVKNKEDAYLKLGFLYQHGYGIQKIESRAIEFYSLAAEKGNADAAYNLGRIFHHSPKLKWNYREAFKWYTKAVENEHPYASNDLAFLYLKGLGTDTDYSKTIYLYTKAAENRNINAMISLARIFRQGKIIEQDHEKSAEWYKKATMEGSTVAQSSLELLIINEDLPPTESDLYLMNGSAKVHSKKGLCSRLRSDISDLAEPFDLKELKRSAMNAMKGDGYAMLKIGMKYYNGDDLVQDKDTAFKWIRNAAKSGITSIQCILAKMYKDGDCAEQNYYKASIWYEKAAQQGDADAQYNLGLMYYHGLGVRKDPLEASRWYTFAADKNNSDAQCQLGILRENGEGLRQDIPEALQWFNISVRQKNPKAIYRLAQMHENKNLEKSSFEQTITLYEKAAQLGNLEAQLRLANIYGKEKSQQWNEKTASKYYKMAANQGNPEAKYKLAIMYLDGEGVSKHWIKAYHLFKESSDLGYVNSKNIFDIPVNYSKTTDIDYYKVIQMFELVCENGIDSLEYNIGSYYSKGVEFVYNNAPYFRSANDLSAQLWYEAAAKKGVPEAHQKLAVIFEEKNKFSSAVKHYKNAYNLGNTDVTYKLACMYLNGHHVFQNFKKAFSLFNEASDKGHKEVYKILNFVEYDNQNGSIDLVKEMFQISADSGNVISQYKLGLLTLEDKSQEHRIQEAITWLYKATRGGFIEASYRLGLLFEDNTTMKKDYLEIIRLYKIAADKGHEKALFRLAQLYHFGERIERNYLKAFEFYTSAAQQRYQPAELAINITSKPTWNDKKNQLADDSEKLHLDYDSYFHMWEYVADKGNSDLQYKLGVIYEENGGDLNMVQAAEWYSKAACSSHEDALNNLGRLYQTGQGVSQDYKKSIELYERSSYLDNNEALYKLGVIYHSGKGVKPDLKIAHTYFTRATRKGNSMAQFELGKLYEEGVFLPQNKLEALKQFSLSASQGNKDAEIWLNTYYDGAYDDHFLCRQQLNLLNRIIKKKRDENHKDISFLGSVNYELGRMYYHGYGAPVDYEKAWKYWKSSMLYGDIRAREISAIKYENINIKIKDSYLKKLEMFEAVAEQLSVEDIYELASIYYHGVYSSLDDFQSGKKQAVVQPDLNKSSKYFRLIIERELPEPSDYYIDCSFYMGMINFVDIKHKNDSSKARYYLKNAHSNGSFDSQFFLDYINDKNADNISEATVFKKVFEWHNNNQNDNHIKLIYNIGWMYDKGLGTQQDYKKAIMYYEIVARKESVSSYFELEYASSNSNETKQGYTTSVKWYTKEAIQNIVTVYCNLGNIYFHGEGVKKDYKIAFQNYSAAAKKGNSEAQAQLGILYHKGYEVEQNYAIAIQWYTKAADQNHLIANYSLGNIYYNGEGVIKDYKLAFQYYKTAADQDHSDSQVKLGTLYALGFGVKQNYKAAIEWYKKAASQYSINANYNLGLLYYYGQGTKKDYKLSFKYYKFAADKGHSDAQNSLEVVYEKIHSVKQDHTTDIEYHFESARQNHASPSYNLGQLQYCKQDLEEDYKLALLNYKAVANKGDYSVAVFKNKSQMILSSLKQSNTLIIEWPPPGYERQDHIIANYTKGQMYYYGQGVEKNYSLAFKYYKFAADQERNYLEKLSESERQNHVVANYTLGQMYYYGEGVEKNHSLAFQYYKFTADQGHSDAQYSLGIMYENGNGIEQDYTAAVKWYTKAANQRHYDANFTLGQMYYHGQGIKKDYSLALKYYKVAADKERNDLGNIYGSETQNHVIANYALGQMYYYGEGVERNYKFSFKYYKAAAYQGHSDAQNSLGVMYENGNGVKQNYTAAVKWYTKSSKQDHSSANYSLGNIYFYGRYVEHDYRSAFLYYRRAAKKGHIEAQVMLGIIYTHGYESDVDYEMAMHLFSKASDKNNIAMVFLGLLCHVSYNKSQNFSKALEYYNKVEGLNTSFALRGIGLLYEHGDGVEKIYERAIDFYLQSADRKNKGAYYNIALLHYYGRGVERNFDTALVWFSLVIKEGLEKFNTYVLVQSESEAESNAHNERRKKYLLVPESIIYGEAHYYLGLLHRDGQDTSKNPEKALYHFRTSHSLGIERARNHLDLEPTI